ARVEYLERRVMEVLAAVVFRMSIVKPRKTLFFFFQAEDGIRDFHVTGVQTCALPIFPLETSIGLFAQIIGERFSAEKAKAIRTRSEERRVGKECRSRWSPWR